MIIKKILLFCHYIFDNINFRNFIFSANFFTFNLFFPFATNNEMSYTVTNGKVEIETNSDLQRMLNRTSLSNQLIYSSFYCEKIDWIIEYANIVVKYFMPKILKLNMIVANVEIKQMYIKVEIKIKLIKSNCWNCRKSIVFKIKLKYNKSILFQRKSLRKEVQLEWVHLI